MKEYIWTFIFQILNLMVLYVFMRWLLFKPIKNYLDRRTQAFQAKKEELDRLQNEIEANRQLSKEELERVRQQVRLIMEEAEQTAQARIIEAEKKAQQQAEAIIEEARRKIEDERVQAIETLKDQAAILAVEMASRIIKTHFTAEDNRDLINEFLEKVELK
ncbi:MAG: ATP synthase F0 subunit B [Clostridiales bacterium]|jgi:F-type H+-transporting ATPase subunit b|nr:ATP synthase F0 subunit B [Clostridiales bacterium]